MESDEGNNTANQRVSLVDGAPDRVLAIDPVTNQPLNNLTPRQAEEWLTRNHFTEVPWQLRELPGYFSFRRDGGYYKALPKELTLVSPHDGRDRDGRWYRQHAQIDKDENHSGKFKITIQGTPSFGEPDPWFAVKRAGRFNLLWLYYVAKWHNAF